MISKGPLRKYRARDLTSRGVLVVLIVSCVMFGLVSPVGTAFISGAGARPISETRWIIIGQAADCAEAVGMVMRRARRLRLSVPAAIHVVAIDSTFTASPRPGSAAYGEVRAKILRWNLWFSGIRGTPILLEIPAGEWRGSVTLLSPG